MYDLDTMCKTIDYFIDLFLKTGKFVLPKQNAGSYYKKACWLLAKYQMGAIVDNKFMDNVNTLKEWLPELRKANI